MQAATDVHCNKRQRVDSVGDDSVGQLPTKLVTAPTPREVKANFFHAHTQQHTPPHCVTELGNIQGPLCHCVTVSLIPYLQCDCDLSIQL